MKIVTRFQAKSDGLKRYFEAKECPNGHVAERFTNCGKCTACGTEQNRARVQWRKDRREKMRDQLNEWQRGHYVRNAEKMRARRRAYFLANKAECLASRVKWGAENKDYLAQYYLDYARANREQKIANYQRRRARLKGSKDHHTGDDLKEILKLQKHKCAYCSANLKKVKINFDHIIPLSKGGSNHRSNIQATCADCNRYKGARHPVDFARSRGMLL